MTWINYHHLYYYWVICKEMNITKASKKLRLSQSTVSAQLKQLEDNFGHKLLIREKNSLKISETGKIVLDYANSIFSLGEELKNFIQSNSLNEEKTVIKIGAISTLSKNLQLELVRPLLLEKNLKFVFISGNSNELIKQLQNHSIDIIISNIHLRNYEEKDIYHHNLINLPVHLVCSKKYKIKERDLITILKNNPLYLPTQDSKIREEIDIFFEKNKIRPNIIAEIEDMGLLRLFILSGNGVGIIPEIVVINEIKSNEIIKINRIENIQEQFYLVTRSKKYPKINLEKIIQLFKSEFLLKNDFY